MKGKLGPIDKYKPLWEGGKSIQLHQIKIGFKIRMFVVNTLSGLRQKNPNAFSPNDIAELKNMIIGLSKEKEIIPKEEQDCTLEEYQEFLNTTFKNIDYEDRHGTVTMKTVTKFRLMSSYIDVLTSWEPLDEEMKKCKKYCQFKAVDIHKALKAGKVPKRGGPNEQEEKGDEG